MSAPKWSEAALWFAGFFLGEVLGTYAGRLVPAPPKLLFDASLFASLAGICLLFSWLVGSTRALARGVAQQLTVAYVALSAGLFLGYIA